MAEFFMDGYHPDSIKKKIIEPETYETYNIKDNFQSTTLL